MTAGCFSAGVQDDADREAAIFADRVLLDQFTQVAAAVPAPERFAAVRRWVESPDETLPAGTASTSWLVTEASGDELSVTVYYHWYEKTFEVEAWGLACRVYRVDTTVTVRTVRCPEGVTGPPGD
ncbi:MAG: hypothetical protein ACRCY8_18530 [Dermatophilaceae bacterium]